MVTTFKGLANKWVVLALLLASLGAVLAVTLLPAGAQTATIKFAENSEEAVADFTAVDPEGRSLATWSIPDAGVDPEGDLTADDNTDGTLFSISSAGVLTFNGPPNYEAPAGGTADDSNTYEVVLAATDSQQTSYQKVEVEVTNEEEAATTGIELNLVQPREGQPVTVVYTDGTGNPLLTGDGMSITPAAGATNSGIMDPDQDKDGDTTPNTAISADDVVWQWSRGSSQTGTFTDITESENGTRNQISYQTIDADRGRYLRVTATYQDGHGKGKTLTATSQFPVAALRADTIAPSFPTDFDSTMDGEQGPSAEVADGAGEGTNVGEPVRGRAESGERLTYSLVPDDGGTATHADLFQIDRDNGQVSVGIGKTVNPFSDANTAVPGPKPVAADNQITITIMIIDGAPPHTGDDGSTQIPHSDTVDMTITVKPEIDEPPVFTEDKTSHEFKEDAAALLVDVFAAYDPETATAAGVVDFALSGTDEDAFTITGDMPNAGEVEFAFTSQPDYEDPDDANKDNVYEVTLTASATSAGETEKSTSIDITVTVVNVNEAGVVSMSAREPRIGVPIRAMVDSDDDGRVTGITWQWERDEAGTAGTPTTDCDPTTNTALAWEDAEGDGTTSATYTPNSDDDGKCLRATASYTDPQGPGTANVVSEEAVEKARNLAPNFRDDDNITSGIQINPRYVVENAAADAPVVLNTNGTAANADTALDRVLATDAIDADTTDDDQIDYSLSGPDAGPFTINDDGGSPGVGGQISVKSGAKLDYETKRVYMVTVTAADLEGLSSSVMVVINIVDENEGPEIKQGRLAVSGQPLVPYTSMSTDDVATYTAVGVDASGATWSLSGDDAGVFSISTTGVLTFNTPPDSGSPADANSDNMYEVTVEASSGNSMASKMVTVVVGMEDAAADPTSLNDFTSRQRFDLNGDGIVDASEVREVLRQYFADN